MQEAAAPHGFEIFERQRRVGEQLFKPCAFGVIARGLEHIRLLRLRHIAVDIARGEISAQQQACLCRIAGIKSRHQQRQRIAARAACGPWRRIENFRVDAPALQGPRERRARDPGAEDGHAGRSGERRAQPERIGRRSRRLHPPRLQPLALAAMPLGFRNLETRLRKPPPHRARDRERAQPGARRRACGNIGIETGVPHVVILRGTEPVEEPGIRLEGALRQRLADIAEMQDEAHAVFRKCNAPYTAHRLRPVRRQRVRQVAKFGPGRKRAGSVLAAQGIGFKTDEGQLRRG